MSGSKDAWEASGDEAAEHARKAMGRAKEQAGGDFAKAFALFQAESSSDPLLREHVARLCFDTISDEVKRDRPDLKGEPEAFFEEMLRRLRASLSKAARAAKDGRP
jgi:hypothetical protein